MANIQNAGLSFTSMTRRSRTTHLILHHTAANNQSVQQIHQIHRNLGWAGIGYNFYIRQDGSIWQGRGWDNVGAHTVNYNSTSIGISFEGNYSEQTTMPQAQYNSGVVMVQLAKSMFPTISRVCGHRDLNQTACPGTHFPLSDMIAGVNSNNNNIIAEVDEMTRDEVIRIAQEQAIEIIFRIVPNIAGSEIEARTNLLKAQGVSDWAEEYVDKAKAKGVSDGSEPGMYATREQLITMLGRLGMFDN